MAYRPNTLDETQCRSTKVSAGRSPHTLPWYSVLAQRWSDFVVTFLGVFVAASLSYWIERRRETREEDRREQRERHHLLAYLERVAREVRDNEQWVNKILSRLGRAIEREHGQQWQGVVIEKALGWAKEQAEAFSVAAYDDLARSGLQRFLPDDLQDDLFGARQRVVDVEAILSAAPASVRMAWELSEPMQTVAENTRVILDNAVTALTRVKEPVYKYSASLALEFKTHGG